MCARDLWAYCSCCPKWPSTGTDNIQIRERDDCASLFMTGLLLADMYPFTPHRDTTRGLDYRSIELHAKSRNILGNGHARASGCIIAFCCYTYVWVLSKLCLIRASSATAHMSTCKWRLLLLSMNRHFFKFHNQLSVARYLKRHHHC